MLTVKIFNSIYDVPHEGWQTVVNNHSVCFSSNFIKVLEQAKINDFNFYYLVFFQNDEPIAISCAYTITTDLAIFSKGFIKSLLSKIRIFCPYFFQIKVLECATPITINPPFVFKSSIVSLDELVSILDSTLKKIACKEKAFLIVCRDFENDVVDLCLSFKKKKYHLVHSLPSTSLKIKWASINDYLNSLKSYYRSKIKKYLKKNQENGVTSKVINEFSHLASILSKQWLVVFNNAREYQRESLNEAFYREFSRGLGNNSKVILFYKNNNIIGHALLLIDGQRLRWLYFGREKACNDSLYLYVVYSVIETAINLSLDEIELGLTTYSIKKDFGAMMTENKMAIKTRFFFFNYFVGLVYPLLNQVPKVKNKSVFKDRI